MKKTTRRTPTPIANRAPAGRPVAGRPGQLVAKANRWRDNYNPLRALSMARVVSLLEAGERGEFAELQWAYKFVEKRNATCRALILRRASALLKLDWDIKVPEILPPGVTQAMADEQQKTLRSWYDRIANLREAIRELALAEFRGFAHLQIQSDDGKKAGIDALEGEGSIRLTPLHQWFWVRDGSAGGWGWNPEAALTGWEGTPAERRVDPDWWGLIIREVSMPIDELALIGFVRKGMSQKDWDGFVEIYGIPGGVVTMPPGVPEGKESEYEDSATKVAEGGSGTIPHGAIYEANDGPRGENPFRDHIQYQDQELVLAGTGGKLTMLTESGSGTLAGGAHQDAFDEIAEGEAEEISEVLQKQFDRRILDMIHPGQPRVAYFELACEPDDDTDKLVERAVKLHQIGFRSTAEEMSERTGLNLTEAPKPDPRPGDPAKPADPAEPPVRNRVPSPTPPDLEAAGAKQLSSALAADLAPILRRMKAVEAISDPEIRKARAEALLAEWESLQEDVLADPEAVQALARIQGAAMAEGLTEGRR